MLLMALLIFAGIMAPETKVDNSFSDIKAKVRVSFLLDDILRDPDSIQNKSFSKLYWDEGKKIYWIEHSFRSKNGFGGYVVSNMIFTFKKNGDFISYKNI